MPPASPLADLFKSSPIGPIQTHSQVVLDAAVSLKTFFKSARKGDWTAARETQKHISRLERDADKLKSKVRKNLPKSLFMPVSRSDLLELVRMQDRIANVSKDIAGVMLGRRIEFPLALQETLADYVEASIETCESSRAAIAELDTLIGVGFGRREFSVMESKIEAIGKLERRTDKLQVKLRKQLFGLEGDMNPVEVVFLYKVIDLVGDLADSAERVGSRLEILVAV